MSAEVLRRAAALMRERAEAAQIVTDLSGREWYRGISDIEVDWVEDAAHIASWRPAVALAVADWLDRSARQHETLVAAFETGETGLSPLAIDNLSGIDSALKVALAYLGGRP